MWHIVEKACDPLFVLCPSCIPLVTLPSRRGGGFSSKFSRDSIMWHIVGKVCHNLLLLCTSGILFPTFFFLGHYLKFCRHSLCDISLEKPAITYTYNRARVSIYFATMVNIFLNLAEISPMLHIDAKTCSHLLILCGSFAPPLTFTPHRGVRFEIFFI